MKRIFTIALLFLFVYAYPQTTPGKHSIKNLNVNTETAEFSVALYGDDQLVFAAPSDKVTIIRNIWRENRQPYLDIYRGQIDSTGQITGKTPVQGDVNRKYHEAVVTFTKDLKTVYYSANNYGDDNKPLRSSKGFDNIQLYKASINDAGEWVDVVKLPFNSDEFQTGQPALNQDDTKLYFVSDRPGGYGKTDIWEVVINKDGTYGEPMNLGPVINTEEREMFPFLADDNILYFSSDGHPGYGNLDIFASKLFDHTISKPLNLEPPVNSPKDDFAYLIEDTKHKGFFSSNREEGKGDDDIYSFKEDEELFIECLQTIKGVVRDKDSLTLLPGTIVELYDDQGNQVMITAADEDDASFSFDVPCNTQYKLIANREGYLRFSEPVKTANDLDLPAIENNIDMSTEFKWVGNDLLVNINTIYFDFDKYNIRPDAATELDKVIEVMQKYPELKIHAASYTDSRGSTRYNKRLSEKRAKSSVEYIISKGIDPGRLTSEGLGESDPVNGCVDGVECTEEQYQENRRTNFKVVADIQVKREE